MSQYRMTALAVVMLAAVCPSWGATPSQVGTYTGSLKLKVYTPAGRTNEKLLMTVEIAADDSTTVTLDGVLQTPTSLGSGYGPTEGFFIWGNPTFPEGESANVATAHFKKTTLSGSVTGSDLAGTTPGSQVIRNVEGKFKLKKLP
jgi:hypothetical protein